MFHTAQLRQLLTSDAGEGGAFKFDWVKINEYYFTGVHRKYFTH